ncbi:MAG TPA: endonuclease/exonuclease/phosphatase family protein, partial [Acidimicrobiia bacterium]|nr:endonuclease/exonuclease/phosphatase family protein [Acidimicrobiia bacterium]
MDCSRRRRALLAAVVVALLAGAPLTTGAGRASAAGRTVRVMQFNFCGSICNRGVVDKSGANNDVVEDIRNRIVSARPDIVALNEACEAQVNRLKALLQGSSWSMGGVFRDQRADGRCQGGQRFGDAVLTAGTVGRQEVLPLPNGGSEHRAILCLHTDAGGPVLACALHLVTGKAQNRLQLAAAAKILDARAAAGPVILGGDFNAQPSAMAALLDAGRGGQFSDTDPQKAPTRGQKIDYVLFSRGHF